MVGLRPGVILSGISAGCLNEQFVLSTQSSQSRHGVYFRSTEDHEVSKNQGYLGTHKAECLVGGSIDSAGHHSSFEHVTNNGTLVALSCLHWDFLQVVLYG